MGRHYKRLEIEEFGAHLLTTGDLDPVYLALNGSGFSEAQRLRWLAAYTAFYHCGVSCWLSERDGEAFWSAMAEAAADVTPSPVGGKWPRGHERRYFYGRAARTAIEAWRDQFPCPEAMYRYLRGPGYEPFAVVVGRARTLASVGPWLSFKVVDLVDACLDGEVEQVDLTPFLYETPYKSLRDVCVLRGWIDDGSGPVAVVAEAAAILRMFNGLKEHFASYRVPHKPGRRVDNFCVETIACKHGSHMSGHYALYTDIDDISHGLARWDITARSVAVFAEAMPRRIREGLFI